VIRVTAGGPAKAGLLVSGKRGSAHWGGNNRTTHRRVCRERNILSMNVFD